MTSQYEMRFPFTTQEEILDYPALSAVGITEEYVRGSEYPFWQEYVNRCRAEAERYDVSMRTLDRALWKYSESGNPRGHR